MCLQTIILGSSSSERREIRIYIVADGYREIDSFYIVCDTLYLRISENNVEPLAFM